MLSKIIFYVVLYCGLVCNMPCFVLHLQLSWLTHATVRADSKNASKWAGMTEGVGAYIICRKVRGGGKT